MSRPCLCLNNKLFNTGENRSAVFRLAPGRELLVSFTYTNAPNAAVTLYTGKGFAFGVDGTGFNLTNAAPSGAGLVSIAWRPDGKVYIGINGEDARVSTPSMALAKGSSVGEFYIYGYDPSKFVFTNVSLVIIPGSPITPMSDEASVNCFSNQISQGRLNSLARCSTCTSDNILKGCLDIDLGALSWYEIALGVGAFILAALLIRRIF